RNNPANRIDPNLFLLFASMPAHLRKPLTFDNGTEFALHHLLHQLGIQTFFCDPYSPWQKGGIENAIGRMRRFIPRKTDLAMLPKREFNALLRAYNSTPRKCLDFKTPAETFSELLHFECESTSPLSRGRADGGETTCNPRKCSAPAPGARLKRRRSRAGPSLSRSSPMESLLRSTASTHSPSMASCFSARSGPGSPSRQR